MFDRNTYLHNSKQIKSENDFESLALELFQFQAIENPVYQQFLSHLSIEVAQINTLEKIPFLPIDFFKTQQVSSKEFVPQAVFESSGTTSENTSKHYVKDVSHYLSNARAIFNAFYGNPSDYTILALLPSYLERQNSSLVFMVDDLIKASQDEFSGFYLDDYKTLIATIEQTKKPVILFGVTFALLDLVEKYSVELSTTIIIETGGMKGRRKEITREELHLELQKLHPKAIHSEYGMTELLSQAYATDGHLFKTPAQMKFLVCEVHDPFAVSRAGVGVLNVIDLANIDSCGFIATQDLAKIHANGETEILGRMDNSDIRGCNLLVIN